VPGNKLCMSTNFIIFRPIDQKLWVFENFRKSLGRASMCWSQWGVDHMWKSWRQEERKGRGNYTKMGARAVAGRQPLVAGQLWPAIWQTVGWLLFSNFFDFLKFFIKFFWVLRWSLGMGLAFWENGYTAPPFFEACPYTWKCSINHSSWSLEISFSFKFFG
jgi:hypothetical protein